MRAKIKSTGYNEVTLSYEEDGQLVERYFYKSGRAVMEAGNQVCEGLVDTGNTLSSSADLVDIIRREYKLYKKMMNDF